MTTQTLETHLERGNGPLRSMQMIATFSPNMLRIILIKTVMVMVLDGVANTDPNFVGKRTQWLVIEILHVAQHAFMISNGTDITDQCNAMKQYTLQSDVGQCKISQQNALVRGWCQSALMRGGGTKGK